MTTRAFKISSAMVALACSSVVVATRAAAEPCNAGTTNPQTVHVAPDLCKRVAALLEKSPTFRSQWDRLAREPHLYVRVELDTQLTQATYRARSIIRHLDDGAIVASVEISPVGDPTEWIAHELEHVIEQLEGLDLGQLARSTRRAAWSKGDRMFETARALRVGRRVLDETRARAPVQLLAVASSSGRAAGAGDPSTSLSPDKTDKTDLSSVADPAAPAGAGSRAFSPLSDRR